METRSCCFIDSCDILLPLFFLFFFFYSLSMPISVSRVAHRRKVCSMNVIGSVNILGPCERSRVVPQHGLKRVKHIVRTSSRWKGVRRSGMSLRNVRRFPVPSSREGNTGGKEGGYPCGGRFNDPETVVVPARFSLRFFEERLEMQPTLETRYCSGLFRSSGTLTAFRSQKRFSPLLKIAHGQQALFLFFLSWFRFAR